MSCLLRAYVNRLGLCLVGVLSGVLAIACTNREAARDGWLDERENDREFMELGARYQELKATKAGRAANGAGAFCDDGNATCGAGEGDCDSDAQCMPGLACGVDNGAQFGFQAQFDVCWPAHCENGVQDGAETAVDCGGACGSCDLTQLLSPRHAAPDAPFTLLSKTNIDTRPWHMATADLNGDNFADLAVAARGESKVSVLLGSSDGTFTLTSASVGLNPFGVAIADVDQDGFPDILTANNSGQSVSILWNTRNRAAPFPTGMSRLDLPTAAGAGPAQVTAGDFDKDGRIDLAVANWTNSTVEVRMGTGPRTFGEATVISIGSGRSPRSIISADFNRDGRLDLAVGSWSQEQVGILLFDTQARRFSNPAFYQAGQQEVDLQAADLDGDGLLDLAVTNMCQATISLLRGNGNGTFCAPKTLSTGSTPVGATIRDLNCDNTQDIVVAEWSTNNVSVYLGHGNLTEFTSAGSYAAGQNPVMVVNLSLGGDDTPDLAIANYQDNNVAVFTGGSSCSCVPADCDDGNACTVDTCVQSTCQHKVAPSGTICRDAAGLCDVAETCSGTTCPADTFKPKTFECRPVAGPCDVAEKCTGSSPACPTDLFKPNTIECRASAGVCDVAEKCSGTYGACPTDLFKLATVECRASAGVCDAAESCSGTSPACPADALKPNTAVCRPPAGACDVAEYCTGSSMNCPPNALRPSSYVCRPAVNPQCDIPETCNGTAAACPTDSTVIMGTDCGDPTNNPPCNYNDICDGKGHCDRRIAAAGTSCGDALFCNGAEQCDANGHCLAGQHPCPDDGNDCSLESCDETYHCQIIWRHIFDGSFSSATSTFPVRSNPYAIVLADLNQDGTNDIATANLGDDTVSIVLSKAHPPTSQDYFQPAITISLNPGANPFGIAAADLDQDGATDFVTANGNRDSVSILWGALSYGSYSISAVEEKALTLDSSELAPSALVLADFDRNGRKDIAVANWNDDSVSVLLALDPARNRGFRAPSKYTVLDGGHPQHMAVGDIDQDGDLDLIIAHSNSSDITVLFNNGRGGFDGKTNYAVCMNQSFVMTGHFANDTSTDVAVLCNGSNTLAILENSGIGGLLNQPVVYPTGSAPVGLATGDFWNGPAIDMVFVADWGANAVDVRDVPDLAHPALLEVGPMPSGVVVGDFTGDTVPDLAVPNFSRDRVTVIPGIDACLGAHCGNGRQDGDEQGLDCGGACPPCP